MVLKMNYSTHKFAQAALQRWRGDGATLEHVSDSGNSVYRFGRQGTVLILRLTDPGYRSRSQVLAELDYLQQLHAQGVLVGVPVAAASGNLLEAIQSGGATWLAAVFTFAPGSVPLPDTPAWDETLFREWGRTLGRLHRVSSRYTAPAEFRRWHWHEEDLVANAARYIPAEDRISQREFDALKAQLQALPVSAQSYGMTHADLGAQNFHYDPQHGITVFDFGNCCYHWYASDLAIALSTLRGHSPEQRDDYRRWMLDGYQEILPLDPVSEEHLDLFIRWRVLYVYLDRLERFRPVPTPAQQQILDTLRGRVHQQANG